VLFVFASAQVSFAEEPAPIDFNKQVQPILAEKCIRCHGERQRGGMLDMRTLEAMLKGGVSGPAFVPGKSDKSLMIELIHFKEMPPRKDRGPRVTPDEFKLLKAWIDAASPPQP
jgi:cytochrome c